ncbi:MAG: hypothetical protein FJZ47_08700 [Candidatus Tectomicrobia bacterium]|uniref:Uncharacterized protein n=1 Tax=Tectimicrobiota bacterium TaxID=2528274 RepID=A0A937VZ61_UNCTE|nr:hypothetical protein [Candidatus Tectomicrobia bacterium]
MCDDLSAFAQTLGLPAGDLDDLPTSSATFPDGAHYRLEVPTINTPEALGALLETAEQRYGVVINRVDETAGIFRLTTQHIREYVTIARAHGVERYYPEARQSSRGAADLAVPVEPKSWESVPISPAELVLSQHGSCDVP